MTDTIVIDIVAEFKDKATPNVKKTQKAVNDLETSAKNLSKQKHSIRLGVKDEATTGIRKVMTTAKNWASRKWQSTISFVDKATTVIEKVNSAAKGFASKTFKATMSVVDKFTTPLTKLKNMLFSINSLITTVAAGLASKLVVAEPVSYADTMTTASIAFETMLGSPEASQKMMSDIMDFAKKTPFDTNGLISSTQQMMAFGFEADETLGYMEKIGNVMSAMGKGEEGIDSVTRALGQMRATGRVNAQDMMQLTSVGIKAWDYLAKGMGKSVADVRKMSEDGEIAAETAITHIMNGLSEFDGMMDKMSNRTVSGLWSNIKDTFQQSVVLDWGEGLQKGAIQGLVDMRDWLDRVEPLLQSAGTSLEKFGESASTAAFDLLNDALERLSDSLGSEEFKNADSLGEKISIVWDDVIWQPFSEWWESTGKPKLATKMAEFGEALGKGISNGMLALLGIDVTGTLDEGASIGASFAEGFASGFDGEAVGEAMLDAIKDVFASGGHGLLDLILPGDQGASTGNKIVGAGLAFGGASLLPKGIEGAKSLKSIIGSATKGKGVLGGLAKVGTSISGGSAAGGTAAAIGGGSILGGILGALGIGSGAHDIYQGATSEDSKTKKTEYITGASKIGMVGAGALAGGKIGAAIGSVGGPIGTGAGALIGAGVGGLGAILGGDKFGAWISDLTDEGGALNNMGKTVKNFFTKTIPEKWGEFWTGVGDFFTETVQPALSSAKEKVTTFFTETIPEKWSEFWEGVGDFFTETVPYALGYAAGKLTTFFTETLPEKWGELWDAIGTFFTETIPTWADTVWNDKIVPFFSEDVPAFFSTLWSTIKTFFTETLPLWAENTWNDNIVPFFTEDIPSFFSSLWTSIKTFFTETIPTWAGSIWNDKIVPFFTEDIPGFFSDIWDSVTGFFEESLPSIAGGIWGTIKGWFSSAKEWFGSVWDSVKGSFSSGFSAGSGEGVANNANGGFINGKTLSWLGEEGTPEVVIPLGSHRRGRAMDLWQRTGELLGVKPAYNALGGIVGATMSESTATSVPISSAHGGGNVKVDVGGVTISISTSGNSGDIVSEINAKQDEIAEIVAGALHKALEAQFSNTPLAAR